MVARIRLSAGWHAPEGAAQVVGWTLVVPPVLIQTPDSAGIYYALSHCQLIRPLIVALFKLRQVARRCALDLSEIDAAAANYKLEAFCLNRLMDLPAVGAREVLEAHMACILYQQQLIT
ncbi:MAG: hypothetical protein ACKPKO_56370, partial [Candidatus Fonsibacter sp.]